MLVKARLSILSKETCQAQQAQNTFKVKLFNVLFPLKRCRVHTAAATSVIPWISQLPSTVGWEFPVANAFFFCSSVAFQLQPSCKFRPVRGSLSMVIHTSCPARMRTQIETQLATFATRLQLECKWERHLQLGIRNRQ